MTNKWTRRIDWGRLFAAQSGEDGVEVFEAGVLDDDAALALLVLDVDREAESAPQAVLGFADVGVFGLGGFRVFLRLCFGVDEALDVAFGLADREIEGHDLLRGGGDGFGGVESQEGAGVAEGEVAGVYLVLDRFR